MTPDSPVVDALGTWCPVPIRLLARAIARLTPGTRVTLLADDPLIEIDLPAWCSTAGHRVEAIVEEAGRYRCVVLVAARDVGDPSPG